MISKAMLLALLAGFMPFAADAQTMIDRSSTSTSTTALAGVNLPTPASTYGQDEVQAAGGVACRSAVGGNGAYIDTGVVGSNDLYNRNSATAYARVVMPLGRAPKRLDCGRLYDLEIQRLRMELELARMSMPGPANATATNQPAANAMAAGMQSTLR